MRTESLRYLAAWRCPASAALLLLVAHALPAHAATVYDLRTDWSNTVNPNGVWSYNDGNGPIVNHVADYLPGVFSAAQPAWVYAASGPGHIVSWFKTAGTSPGIDFQPGDIVTHTWDGASSGGLSVPDANVTWTSLTAGSIDLSGSVWLARDIGRAVDWSLAINGQALTGGSLFSGDPFDRSNPFSIAAGSGGAAVLNNIAVAQGDRVALSFNTRSNFGDFTGVNFQVEFTPIPEPATCAFLVIGSLALLSTRTRRGIHAAERALEPAAARILRISSR